MDANTATGHGGRRTSKTVAALLVVATIAVGCGGDDDDGDDGALTTSDAPAGATADTASPVTTAEASADTATAAGADAPEEIGDAIATLYLAVYDDVIATLEDRPEPAEATTLLSELKESYIVRFVELGHRREALDAAGRGTVDATVGSAVMSLDEETLAAYQAALDHYVADPELSDLIRSFNIIGQYAAFDLLRQQDPDEAARLGID